MTVGYHPGDERDAKQGIERAVKHVPETNVEPPHLPELRTLVRHEAQGHEIQDAFDDIQVAVAVDGVDGHRIQDEIEDREENLDGVLIDRRAHPIGVEVRPELRVAFAGPGNEVGGVGVILDEPSAPEIGDAFLVAGGPDDGESMEIDGPFDGVGGIGGLAIGENGEAFQKQGLEEVGLVLFGFDAGWGQFLSTVGRRKRGNKALHPLRHDFTCYRSYIVQIGVPELDVGLSLEPAQADEQAVDDAGLMLFPTRFPGRSNDVGGDDRAVGLGDFPFFELAGDDLFDLVFEPERDFGDVFRRHRGFNEIVRIGGEDWKSLATAGQTGSVGH